MLPKAVVKKTALKTKVRILYDVSAKRSSKKCH